MIDIDQIYADTCAALPEPLAGSARGLAHRLGLAPDPAILWSEVFANPVTLRVPEMVGAGWPGASATRLQAAVKAHMLAVIEAFGVDRVADEQVDATPELHALLAALRRERDGAAASLDPHAPAAFAAADASSHAAIAKERQLLISEAPASFDDYRRMSLGKQAVGFPASLALARACGLDLDEQTTVSRLLTGIWLGLQFHDDVIDWEEDWAAGGAWAVSLTKGESGEGRMEAFDPQQPQAAVHASGTLRRMLELSRGQFELAAAGATALGATVLAGWADARANHVAAQASGERGAPGYALRRHKLACWAAEVLP